MSYAPWQRPGLLYPQPLDAVFLDIDGVLIYTVESFWAADIAAAEYVNAQIHGLDWGQASGKKLFTQDDVDAFKLAGGFNNDWDMCYVLTLLGTAMLREWKDTPLGERTTRAWAADARQAMLEGHGGRVWVDAVIPETAHMDYDFIGQLYQEFYWGATKLRKYLNREPLHLPDFPGYAANETLLFQPSFPEKLRSLGIQKIAFITGRMGPEVTAALDMLAEHVGSTWWDAVVSADEFSKPDPRALQLAISKTNPTNALYIGDTADDYDLVRNYYLTKSLHDPTVIAAVRTNDDELAIYQERGADLILPHIEDLLTILPSQS
jgi:phosphoglycolate phosphatase-like HAD superfamily hydrolase